MRTLQILIVSSLLGGCVGVSQKSQDTTTILSSSSTPEENLLYDDVCEEESAHITRARLGNRPIVRDGITFYCF